MGIDYVFANALDVDNGEVTGKVVEPVIDGHKKADLLRLLAILRPMIGERFPKIRYDEIRLYDRALSWDKINSLYDHQPTEAGALSVTSIFSVSPSSFSGSTPVLESAVSYTVYEDVEDGAIDGWQVYGEGNVVNIQDTSGNRIMSTEKTLVGYPFRLGLDGGTDWDNTEEFTAYFAILMEEEAAIYFRVDTSDGEKYLCYMSGPQTVSVKNNVVLLSLGIEADGQWHPIYRHLASDLEKALPGTELFSIKDFYVFGSVKLDNVMLIRGIEDQK